MAVSSRRPQRQTRPAPSLTCVGELSAQIPWIERPFNSGTEAAGHSNRQAIAVIITAASVTPRARCFSSESCEPRAWLGPSTRL